MYSNIIVSPIELCKKLIIRHFYNIYGYQTICGIILSCIFFLNPLFLVAAGYNSISGQNSSSMKVGVASIDITPKNPIRLTGYAARENKESEGILRRLHAKALAFSGKDQGLSILITVDLLGITDKITSEVADYLSNKVGINRSQLAIIASHTHGGPEIGSSVNIIQYKGNVKDSSLPLNQLISIANYIDQLTSKLEQVATAAVENLEPSLVAWGQGDVGFAAYRRQDGGSVDHTMPILRVTNLHGELKAILVNYACHGTTLEGDVNKVHGDWIGEAQRIIEKRHPGTTALVAIGAAGDANPKPRGELKHMTQHGKEIADEVDKLLNSNELHPVTSPPVGYLKWIKLPFADLPNMEELIKQANEKSIKGYYSRLALERVMRGKRISSSLSYPIQVWAFGDELSMINLGGEVVAHYALRLKEELGNKHIWVNAYSNDVHSYVASRRQIQHGGYEVEGSMYWYNNPSRFVEEVEDMIIGSVYELLPPSFLTQ